MAEDTLAQLSKKAWDAGEFKEASRLLLELRSSDPDGNYVQLGDGRIAKTVVKDGKESQEVLS